MTADRHLHFAAGMILGMLVFAWPVVQSWRRGRSLTRSIRWLFVASYALGVWAVVPGILRMAGMPEAVHSGLWTIIFVFSPLIDYLRPGGMLVGQLLIVGCFTFQYCLILAAIRRADRIQH